MDIELATALLGGLTPQVFMRRHWQKKPLLVRQAVPGGIELLSRARLFALAASDAVESRLVVQHAGAWSVRHGPFKRAAIPALKQPRWTLLVQGLDLHIPAARTLLDRFRFVPDARLDDLMLSYASDGGGVGPHVDSYDVFLLQARGRRRWHTARRRRPQFVPDAPLTRKRRAAPEFLDPLGERPPSGGLGALRILANFEAEQEWLLEAGDMLYLPPGWAHDGVAQGECLTCSIGFRASGRDEIGRDVLQRMLDAAPSDAAGALYRDPGQAATSEPGRIPAALQAFAGAAVTRLLDDADSLACALGEVLSEPKRGVWFDAGEAGAEGGRDGVSLDQRSRMLYDDRHVFINGEAFRAAGRDAMLMRRLADRRVLRARDIDALSGAARRLLDEWLQAGWVQWAGITSEDGAAA